MDLVNEKDVAGYDEKMKKLRQEEILNKKKKRKWKNKNNKRKNKDKEDDEEDDEDMIVEEGLE